MQRVMRGGHNIETVTIRRRHKSGLQLLASYDKRAFVLLNETIAAAGGQPLAGI
jgi:predicted ABC-type ATPase